MSRGKPSKAQLDLSMGMMDVLSSASDLTCDDGTDCRNYGVLDGIPEMKQLFADMLGIKTEYITVHQEACTHLHRTVQHIKSLGVKAGVALGIVQAGGVRTAAAVVDRAVLQRDLPRCKIAGQALQQAIAARMSDVEVISVGSIPPIRYTLMCEERLISIHS